MSIVTDRAVNEAARWDARQGDTQAITINFSVTQAGKEFEATIYRQGGATVVTLSEDNGKIVNNGTSIVITLDGDNAAIMADTYEWKLRSDSNFTWFCAPFELHNSAWGGSTSSSVDVTVDVGGTSVDLAITIAASHFKGKFVSLVSLQTAYPTATDGDYATVDAGIGTDVAQYIWDSTDNAWVLSGGASDAADVSFTPAGSISATDVQAAIEEVVSDLTTIANTKVVGPASATDNALAGFDGVTGKLVKQITALPNGTTGTTQAASDNSTKVATTAYVDGNLSAGTYSTWSPTWTGFSSDPTSVVTGYTVFGKMCHAWLVCGGNGTSNAGPTTVTLPFAAGATQVVYVEITSSGTAQAGRGSVTSGSNVLTLKLASTSDPASSGNKQTKFSIVYQIQ